MRLTNPVWAGAAALLGLLLVACPLPLAAQAAGEVASTPPLPAMQQQADLKPDMAEPVVSDTYVIGQDDLLAIFVLQMPELSCQVRVDADGEVHLPLLVHGIAALGQTPAQLAQRIARALVVEGIARNPVVQVTVRQVMSHRIVVSGAVKNPIVLQATQPVSLLEVLARAGGLDANAGATVQVTSTVQGRPQVQVLPLAAVLRGAAGADPVLDGGESVQVVSAKMVYTVGALTKPGAFPVQADEPLSVLKALSLSQGLVPHADLSNAEIIRPQAQGAPQHLPINLKQILSRKRPDVALEAGDIFYVPLSGRSQALATIISDTAQLAIIAFGYNAKAIF